MKQQADTFNEILQRLDSIDKKLNRIVPAADDVWLDNKEACEYLKVSSRQMQNYRDAGLVSFSKHGKRKIKYLKSDLDAYLKSKYQKSFS